MGTGPYLGIRSCPMFAFAFWPAPLAIALGSWAMAHASIRFPRFGHRPVLLPLDHGHWPLPGHSPLPDGCLRLLADTPCYCLRVLGNGPCLDLLPSSRSPPLAIAFGSWPLAPAWAFAPARWLPSPSGPCLDSPEPSSLCVDCTGLLVIVASLYDILLNFPTPPLAPWLPPRGDHHDALTLLLPSCF